MELLKNFKKHEIFRNCLRIHLEQAIIHLSKSLNFILIKFLQITSFVNVLEGPTQKVSAIDYQCIGFSKSLRFTLIRNGEMALIFLIVWSFRVEVCN